MGHHQSRLIATMTITLIVMLERLQEVQVIEIYVFHPKDRSLFRNQPRAGYWRYSQRGLTGCFNRAGLCTNARSSHLIFTSDWVALIFSQLNILVFMCDVQIRQEPRKKRSALALWEYIQRPVTEQFNFIFFLQVSRV